MPKARVFFWSCILCIAGIGSASFFTAYPVHIPASILGGAALLISLHSVRRWIRASHHRWIRAPHHGQNIALLCCMAAFAAGMLRGNQVENRWQRQRDAYITKFQNQKRVDILAIIAKRSRNANGYTYILEDVDAMPSMRLLFFADAYARFAPGERIMVRGARANLEKTFESFLRQENAAGTLSFPDSVTHLGVVCDAFMVSGGETCLRYRISGALGTLKESFEAGLGATLPEPHASLAAGLLTGTRTDLPRELQDAFRKVGLSHIVAVSGYNVTIVVLAAATLLGFLALPRSLTFLISTIFLVLFAIMTGGTASVARAALMGFLVLLAAHSWRLYNGKHAIAFAGSLMVLQNPMLIRYDLGFLLSFLATAGLLVLYPLLVERCRNIPIPAALKDIMLQSIAAQLFVLPVLIIATGLVSLIFLFSNLVILPLLPPTMFFSLLAGIGSFFGDTAGYILAFPAYTLLRFELSAVDILAQIPYGAIGIASHTLRWILGIASACGVLLLLKKLKNRYQEL